MREENDPGEWYRVSMNRSLGRPRRASAPDDVHRTGTAQHGAGDLRCGFVGIQAQVGEQIEDRVERALQLDLRDELSDAHVRAEAETERRLLPASGGEGG